MVVLFARDQLAWRALERCNLSILFPDHYRLAFEVPDCRLSGLEPRGVAIRVEEVDRRLLEVLQE